MDIEWSEPPRKHNSPIHEFIEELRKRPGEWGKYPTALSSWGNIPYYAKKNPDVELIQRQIEGKKFLWGRCKLEEQ